MIKVFWKQEGHKWMILTYPAAKLLTLLDLGNQRYKIECLGGHAYFQCPSLDEAKQRAKAHLTETCELLLKGLVYEN